MFKMINMITTFRQKLQILPSSDHFKFVLILPGFVNRCCVTWSQACKIIWILSDDPNYMKFCAIWQSDKALAPY